MKLCGIEVVALHRRAERHSKLSDGYRVGANRSVVTMHIIDIAAIGNAFKQPALAHSRDSVPTHLWNFEALRRLKTLDVDIKDAEAIAVALLRMAAHQLLPDTHTKHRLPQRAYHAVKAAATQTSHCRRRFSHTRENHLVGCAQHIRVGSQHRLHAKTA